MRKIILAIFIVFIVKSVYSQTLTINSVSPSIICGNGSTDTFSYKVSGTNIPANANIVIYQSSTPGFNPYLGQGDSIAGVKGDSIRQPNGCISMMGLFIDACLDGGGDEGQNEYMTIASGAGIKVSNLAIDFGNSNNAQSVLNADINFGTSPCTFKSTPQTALINNLRANAPCNATNIIPIGPSDSIPPNAIILIFTSDDVRSTYNMSGLCAKGFPIYVLQNDCRRTIGAFSNVSNSSQNCNTDSNRYRHYVVRNLATGCYDSLVYDRCHPTSGFTDGTYVVNLPGIDTLSVANGGIKNNPGNSCAGIDFTSDGLDYTQIVKSSDTTFKFSIPPSLCNTGVNYIKAIINPGTPQVTSNTIQYKLVCLDINAIAVNPTICSGQNAVINNSSIDANATFSWTVSGGVNITGESAGSGNQINQTLTNTSTTKDSVLYTITSKDETCTATQQVKIIINPTVTKPNLGRDTAICGSISIPLSTGNNTTIWTKDFAPFASNTSNVTVTQIGTYVASITNSCGTVLDTIIISSLSSQPKPDLGKDTSFCGAVSMTLSTGITNTVWFKDNVQINTGVSSININQTGTYRVVVTGACGSAEDTIIVSQTNLPTKPFIGNDTVFCGNVSKSLSTTVPANWIRNNVSVATNATLFNATDTGTYVAIITNTCGSVSDTIRITQTGTFAKPNLGRDTTICGAISFPLSTGNAITSWFKDDVLIASNQAGITATQPGTYRVTIVGSCSTVADTIVIGQASTPTKPNLGNDTVFCGNVSKSLSTTVPANWIRNNVSVATNTTLFNATDTGTYVAIITNTCGSVSDTIRITQTGTFAKPNLGRDTTICGAISFPLSTGNAITSWFKDDVLIASNQAGITATQPGTYRVTIVGSCSTVADTIIIGQASTPTKPNLGNDTVFCGNVSKSLSTIVPANWIRNNVSVATNTTSFNATDTGTYVAIITNTCGSVSDTIRITQTGTFAKPNLGRDTTICGAISFPLSTGNAITSWFKDDVLIASNQAGITATQPGTYRVTIVGSCSTVADTIIIGQINPLVKPFIGNDTTYCDTFTRVLITGNTTTVWTRNNVNIATASSISTKQGGQYIATITNTCGAVSDTININTANAIKINLGRDTTLCNGNMIQLDATVAGSSVTYLWNTGEMTPKIIVPAQFKKYTVDVSNGVCSASDDIIIDSTDIPQKPVIGSDTTICGKFLYQLITGDNSTIWKRNNQTVASNTISFDATQAGEYIATIKNQCGIAADTITIINNPSPIIELGNDIEFCDSATLKITTSQNDSFWTIIWNTGDTTMSININTAGLYSVVVSDTNNCSQKDSIIANRNCDYDTYLPTAFSPNGDNVNDVLVPLSYIKGIEIVEFVIFDRWSEKIYEAKNFSPNDITKGWNGMYKGENAAVDQYAYYYMIKLPDGKTKSYKGTIALIK